jgi:serine/threonine protein kinase
MVRSNNYSKYEMMIGHKYSTKIGALSVLKLLGKGKSGYSYLAEHYNRNYVLKLMHYEPCPYYSFGNSNKVTLEVNAYHKLREIGITIPKLIYHNAGENYLVKEYKDGITAMELIGRNKISNSILAQLFDMSLQARNNGINIDYFPSNFIVSNDRLVYIDYEFNPYSHEWNLENWGIHYWQNTFGMRKYLKTKDILFLNIDSNCGKPRNNYSK